MPDSFLSAMSTGCAGHPGAAPWPAQSYSFPASEAPDALFIDLGTNDIARAEFTKAEGGDPAFELRFAQETFAFMRNATVLYKKPDIQFFLNAGPMENATMNGTLQAIAMATAAGLKATFVDARRACVSRCGVAIPGIFCARTNWLRMAGERPDPPEERRVRSLRRLRRAPGRGGPPRDLRGDVAGDCAGDELERGLARRAAEGRVNG